VNGLIPLDEGNGFWIKIGDEGNSGVGSSSSNNHDFGGVSSDSSSVSTSNPPGSPGVLFETPPGKANFVPGEVLSFTPAYIPLVGDTTPVVFKFKLVGANGEEIKMANPKVTNPGISVPIRGGGGDPGVGAPEKGSRRNVSIKLPAKLRPGTYTLVTEVHGGTGGGVIDSSSYVFTVYQGSK
jgi:hypothetical protein